MKVTYSKGPQETRPGSGEIGLGREEGERSHGLKRRATQILQTNSQGHWRYHASHSLVRDFEDLYLYTHPSSVKGS